VCKYCGSKFSKPRQLSGHVNGKHIRIVGVKNATIHVDSLSEVQVGYLAAFLDGEGGIQITRTERKDRAYKTALHPTVYFTNTCRPAIDALWEWLGAGTKITARSRDGRKDMYVLHVTGVRNIQSLLDVLLAHLIIKSPQALVMLQYCQSRLAHYRGKGRQYNEKELRLYSALFELNRRGVNKHANARIAD
jgi:hypothetical protein